MASLRKISVLTEFQGKGVGGDLLGPFMQRLREMGRHTPVSGMFNPFAPVIHRR